MSTKRYFVVFFLIVLLTQLLAGCAPAQPENVEITFYKRGYVEGNTDSFTVTTKAAVDAFEKRYPNIKVKIVGIPWGAEGDATLLAALESREDIHVFSLSPADLPDFARKGYLSEAGKFMTDEDKADFYASALETTSVDGKIYAWPLWLTAVAIYANPAIFAERSVTPSTIDTPWTWDQFVAAAQQLTFERADGSKVYGFSASSVQGQVVYLPFFYIDGGRVTSPDGRRFTQNEPEALSALQKIQDLTTLYSVTAPDFGNVDQATVRQQFKDGMLAMIMDTPSIIPELQTDNVDFLVLPIPTGATGKIVTTGGFGMYGVANLPDGPELEAAHLFARYLTGSEIAQDVPGYQLAPGLRRSNQAYATDAPRAIVAQLVSYGLYELPYKIPADVRNRYEAALQAIVTGQKSPDQSMNEIAPEYQQYLDQLNP